MSSLRSPHLSTICDSMRRSSSEIFDVKPKHLDFGIKGARLVAPGKPDSSVLHHRMKLLGPGQMPIIGRKTVDEKGVTLIRKWIAEMKSP